MGVIGKSGKMLHTAKKTLCLCMVFLFLMLVPIASGAVPGGYNICNNEQEIQANMEIKYFDGSSAQSPCSQIDLTGTYQDYSFQGDFEICTVTLYKQGADLEIRCEYGLCSAGVSGLVPGSLLGLIEDDFVGNLFYDYIGVEEASELGQPFNLNLGYDGEWFCLDHYAEITLTTPEPECVPETEVCDGLDNNCNGVVDEGFDLQADPSNCGSCNFACLVGQICQMGVCVMEFDLSVRDVKPIQVIEDPDSNDNGIIDFVEQKPAMARVFVDLVGAYGLEGVKVRLDIFEGKSGVWSTTPVWTGTETVNIKSNHTLKGQKNGKDSVNFFPSARSRKNPQPWRPEREKHYIFRATVDPDNDIEETDEDNNAKASKEVEAGWNKKVLKVHPDMFNVDHPKVRIFHPNPAKKIFEKNLALLKIIYPYNPQMVIRDGFVNRPIVRGFDKKDIRDEDDLEEIREAVAESKSGEIFFDWRRDLGKDHVYFSVLPWEVFVGMRKVAELHEVEGVDPAYGGTMYGEPDDPVILMPKIGGKMVARWLAERYANYLGVDEDVEPGLLYDIGKTLGELSANGWCLDQITGKSCGARVNIYTEPHPKRESGNHIRVNEFDFDTGKMLGLKYYDITAYAPDENSWMSREIYEELMEALVEFK